MSPKKKTKKRKGSPSMRRPTNRVILSHEPPLHIDSQLEKAAKYHRSGQLQKAEKIYKKMLKNHPGDLHCLNALSHIAYQFGRYDVAARFIKKGMQNDPQNPILANNLGLILHAQGRLDEALSNFQKALQLKPDYAEAYNNMGIAFRDDSKPNKAISCFHKALQLEPDYAEAYNNIGTVLQAQGDSRKAIEYFHKALKLSPMLAEAFCSMGAAFLQDNKPDEAVSWLKKALELKPDYAIAHNNLGNAFREQGKLNEAISCFCKAIELEPDYTQACSQLFGELQRICAWQELGSLAGKLDILSQKALDGGTRAAEDPFISLTRHADPHHNLAIARLWSSGITRSVAHLNIDFPVVDRRSGTTKITLGYLSNDFCNHATAHLMLSLFGLHDRENFRVYCYSYGEDDGSYYRKRIEQNSDRFVDLRKLSHTEAAKLIYEDRVDILVDLKGHTKGSRLAICGLRPAPIQTSYLGFPGSTGADFFDYIITDRIVTPEDHACFYSENIVYLPHCYQVNDHTQAISNKPMTRRDVGLPERSFVFCSFNHTYKFDPVMFEVWMKILRQVQEGLLWLPRGYETTERNLRGEAETKGVNPKRLVFAPHLPKGEYLARLRLSDLALDTRIVNGHTTTSDCLWAGVPVITLQGDHFASRVSSSILTAIGLPELVTHSLDEYEALAVRLARDPSELKGIQQRLAKNRSTEPLFDTPRFVKSLERAYKEMWKIFLAGEKPRQIEVVED